MNSIPHPLRFVGLATLAPGTCGSSPSARLDRAMNLDGSAAIARVSRRRPRPRGWREVAAAWMVMVVVVSGLTAWISLRVPHDPPQHLVRISRPAAAEACSERDYANERC